MGETRNNKKGEMGIGTLVIFIGLLLAVAVAAGIYIQTSGNLQEQALTTSTEANNQISTNMMITEIYGTDGSETNLTDLVISTKLSPGSESMDLNTLLIAIGLYDASAQLVYRGVNGTTEKGATGYMTYQSQELGELGIYKDPISANIRFTPTDLIVDLDEDGLTDTVLMCDLGWTCGGTGYDGTHLQFNLSDAGIIYLAMLYPNGSCCTNTNNVGEDYYGGYLDIEKGGDVYGQILLTGETDGSTLIRPEDVDIFNEKLAINDLDDDALDDYVALNDSHILFLTGDNANASVSLSSNIGAGVTVQDVDEDIMKGGQKIGHVVLSGTTSRKRWIDDYMTFTITPQNIGKGYYAVEYVKRVQNHLPGYLTRGELIRIYVENPGAVPEDNDIYLKLIPKTGSPTALRLVTPNVMTDKKIFLYP